MKKSLYKLFLLLPVFSLTACGYSLRELYSGNIYNDPVFENNYYRDWDNSIKEGSGKLVASREYSLSKEVDSVFDSYTSENFSLVEKEKNKYGYYDTLQATEGKNPAFGDSFKMSSIDSSFKYGYISKLFDGQMFCNGDHQLARVQIDENGFGKLFQKELGQFDYFAMNFKASFDFTVKSFNSKSNSKIKLHVGFYTRNSENKYELTDVTYTLNNVPTNTGDSKDRNCYIFFGFSLKNIDISRCCGLSVTYDLLDATAVYPSNEGDVTLNFEQIKSEQIDHSLMLYEVLLPRSTWH